MPPNAEVDNSGSPRSPLVDRKAAQEHKAPAIQNVFLDALEQRLDGFGQREQFRSHFFRINAAILERDGRLLQRIELLRAPDAAPFAYTLGCLHLLPRPDAGACHLFWKVLILAEQLVLRLHRSRRKSSILGVESLRYRRCHARPGG